MVSKTKETRTPLRLTRVVIEKVHPEVDCGHFPIKRVVGEQVEVTADIHADGHDVLFALLQYRAPSQGEWQEIRMDPLVNDRWTAAFSVSEQGRYLYTVSAWTDRFASWRRDLRKKFDAGQDIALDILVGRNLIREAAERASGPDAKRLLSWAEELAISGEKDRRLAVEAAENTDLMDLMQSHADRSRASSYPRELAVVVDRPKARFSAWYEIFPRSCGADSGAHGTFRDCESKLPYIAEMGFDVLYLPPIHPIGLTNRKGKNNSEQPDKDDVGSPWAIGSHEGGHDAIHPQLGTVSDFKSLRSKAEALGLEMALDLAFQCTPDHPYVKEHKEWFRVRPDGSVQYAENPPKKYQDIYPIDFETENASELFEELKRVVLYWIEQGVRIFRVDNPHTKPYQFWEWLISEIKNQHPEVLFLAEAFTRPKVMYRLAKLGFTQSYTYFSWRNTRYELIEYFTELTKTPVREYFRPNLWPNTPDILTEFLQFGGRPAFMIRLLLAATLGASYGIYGPAFELCENRALRPGSEEYLDSEKYQIRQWDTGDVRSLKSLIASVNEIRKENVALQSDWSLQFHASDNDQLLVYSKTTSDFSNVIVVVVNLDPYYAQSGWVDLTLEALGLDPAQPYQMHDLLDNSRYLWHGAHNFVKLDPQTLPAHIFRVRRRVRTERDFDYFL
ncbi:MAG: maltotransferase domain-containing protein [Actinomycetota bacterium]